MAQAKHDSAGRGEKPIVAHRKNKGEWLITMRAEDWFDLYREWEAGHGELGKAGNGVSTE